MTRTREDDSRSPASHREFSQGRRANQTIGDSRSVSIDVRSDLDADLQTFFVSDYTRVALVWHFNADGKVDRVITGVVGTPIRAERNLIAEVLTCCSTRRASGGAVWVVRRGRSE